MAKRTVTAWHGKSFTDDYLRKMTDQYIKLGRMGIRGELPKGKTAVQMLAEWHGGGVSHVLRVARDRKILAQPKGRAPVYRRGSGYHAPIASTPQKAKAAKPSKAKHHTSEKSVMVQTIVKENPPMVINLADSPYQLTLVKPGGKIEAITEGVLVFS